VADVVRAAGALRENRVAGDGDFCVWDLGAEYEIAPEEFLTMGRATPFAGKRVFGRCLMTVCAGKTAWLDPSLEEAE